jgi:hypothetical protein
LTNLFVPTLDSDGLESKLRFKPVPHAERAGHSSWRPPKGIFSRLFEEPASNAFGFCRGRRHRGCGTDTLIFDDRA